MLILQRPIEAGDRTDLALLFGVGLIGGRIASALGRRGWRAEELASPWDRADAFRRHLATVERLAAPQRPRGLHLIWSAGVAGFGSTRAQARREEQRFGQVLSLSRRLQAARLDPVVFHLISSAGGLFEGQRHVGLASRPCPRRPYGRLKLRQEELLAAVEGPFRRRVYRLSSAYGPAGPRGRLGLITTLLHDIRAGRTTSLFGQLTTLRDFVWTEDVAAHVAAACEGPRADESRTEILASGKPTTIHEILHLVTKVSGRPPAVRFETLRDNSSDITFSPSALPAGWSPTDLVTAIRLLHQQIFDPPRIFNLDRLQAGRVHC